MRGELVGVSLATAPGKACYIPLGHRKGDGDLLGGGLIEGQVPLADALARLKPLLEDPAVLKIAQNLKYDYLVFERHGIRVAPYDDTMLISYALDGGKGGNGMDELAQRWLGYTPITFKDVAGSGRKAVTIAEVPLDKATEYAAEDADVTLRLWTVLKPRLAAEHMTTVYETLERPLVPVLARMEARGIKVDRQILSRMSGEFAPEARRPRARDLRAGRRDLQHRLAQAARRHPLRQVRPARRHQDQDRRLVDRRRRARGAGRRRQHARRPHPRLAAAVQAEVDLHRPLPELHPSGDRPRAHVLRARLDHHRAPLLVRPEPAEHPGPHRGRPAHPHRLHRREGHEADLGRLQPDRAPRRSPTSPTSRSSSRPSPTGSTSTP